MKKRISFLLVAVLLLATLIPALPILAADEVSDGQTVANTFNADDANPTISTKEDYIAFFNAAFSNKSTKDFTGKTVTLLNDITFNDTTAENWYEQAGVTKLTADDDARGGKFSGIFDGGNHTLTGVIVEGAFNSGGVGIFPAIGGNPTIKNLNVDGFYVRSVKSRLLGWIYTRNGYGGLIGNGTDGVDGLTIDHVSLKNGVVAAGDGSYGTLGTLIGSVTFNNGTSAVKITNTTVSGVQLVKGNTENDLMGGIIGAIRVVSGQSNRCLDLTGSSFETVSLVSAEEPLKPVGASIRNSNEGSSFMVKNDATGSAEYTWYFKAKFNSGAAYEKTGTYPDSSANGGAVQSGEKYNDSADRANEAILAVGCYGEIPTVKLRGVQQGKNTNDVRFVGLVAKAVVDDKSIDSLGFRLTVGETTVDESQVSCTKVYETILADGETLPAPDGYYFFTFVVTGVEANTEFTFSAVATVGGYIYSAASSES